MTKKYKPNSRQNVFIFRGDSRNANQTSSLGLFENPCGLAVQYNKQNILKSTVQILAYENLNVLQSTVQCL